MSGIKASEDEDPYKPSAPYSTGTIPRHGNRPPGADYEGLFDYEHSVPSAPPIDFMDQVSGYESVSFDAVNIPPPAAVTEQHWENHLSHTLQLSLPRETEQSARVSLLLYAKNHCCYGRTAAKNMAITELKYYSAFHYELQTYTEKRETSWTFTPYSGGEIDGAENGPAPLPWDIEVHPSQLFKDEVKVISVPHTSSVKQCHRCKGTGYVLCSHCYGKGWVWCQVCNENGLNMGSQQRERCMGCYLSTHGKGRQDCLHCSEKGKVGCESCNSHGQIHCYIQLTVSWKVNTAEHIVDHVSLPEHHLKAATGQVAYEEEGARVSPLTTFPDEAINMAASQLIHQHISEFRDRRILAQRQQVRVIPVTAVAFEWKNHEGKFFILGYEKKVYAPDYPQKCCCCSVM